LESIPLDGFDGMPMRFDSKRAVVWCVGEDPIDEGGKRTEETNFVEMWDPMVEVPWLATD
jgi:hypothetical protein